MSKYEKAAVVENRKNKETRRAERHQAARELRELRKAFLVIPLRSGEDFVLMHDRMEAVFGF